MSRARTLAGAIGSDGALNVADVAGLAAVASSGSASDLSTGTLPIARIADGALTTAKYADSSISAAKINATSLGVGFSRTTAGMYSLLTDDGEIITNTSKTYYEKRIVMQHNTFQHILFTFNQNTTNRWIKVMTPQVYSDNAGGGSAEFVASYHTGHAAGSARKQWRAAFGNNHGGTFVWNTSVVESIKVGDSYYSWTPTIYFHRTSDSRELIIQFNGYPGGYNEIPITLEIRGHCGGLVYSIVDLGSSTPSGLTAL